MSFSFGNTTNTGLSFGAASTPAKPAGFGTGFTFGAAASTPGATGFGATAANTGAPAFGAPAASSAPAFGSTGFGTNTGTTGFGQTGTAFGATGTTFGAGTTGTPAFGAPAAGTTGFGTNTGTTFGAPTSTAFGTGTGFGTGTATGFGTSTTGFGTSTTGFGTGTTGFGTGTSTFGTGTTGFGTGTGTSFGTGTGFGTGTTFGATTSQAPTLGAFGQPASGSLFGGTSTAPAFGTAGSTFGKPGGAFGGFGTGLSTFGQTQPSLLGQPQQQQQQQPPNPVEALANSVLNCCVYGDDRDSTLARWNYLQAAWGTGKGYYSSNAPPVEINQQNPMCRFKAIGYSAMPGRDNREGIVAIFFNKKEADVKSQQPQLIASLNNVLGNKPNLNINIDGIKSLSENKTQVLIFVQEKTATNTLKKIPATELHAFLLQPMQKQQLGALGVDNVLPHVLPDQDQIKEYLETPPDGIDPRLWKQAQADNPNPAKYIPVPMVGFSEVKWRMKCQEEETKRHQAFLDRVAEDISALQRKHTATGAKLAEQHRKYAELQHRLLQVIVKQETTRKVGLALQPEEELLRSQLESMQAQISAPTQFKGRLSELLSQIRMQRCQSNATQYTERYKMDKVVQDEMKSFLEMQQRGLSRLIETVNSDLDTLKVISDGMTQLLRDRGVSL